MIGVNISNMERRVLFLGHGFCEQNVCDFSPGIPLDFWRLTCLLTCVLVIALAQSPFSSCLLFSPYSLLWTVKLIL